MTMPKLTREDAQAEVVRQFGHDHYFQRDVTFEQIEDLLRRELDSGDCWTPDIEGALEQLCMKCDVEHQFDADLVRIALDYQPRDPRYGDES
jgi:hypothetical protein